MAMSQPEQNAFAAFHGRTREGLVIQSRRGMLKASLAGLAGLSLPRLLAARDANAVQGPAPRGKSVILLWMAGGPSHIDTWDPKPSRPIVNRGPFGVVRTSLPGVVVGSLVLVGLPEILTELQEFRLLFYGAALVLVMLVRPEGLWPEATHRREFHEGEEQQLVDAEPVVPMAERRQ